MNAVEFSGKIKKGKIIVPKEYQDSDADVRVIMVFEEVEKKVSKKETLLGTLKMMKKEDMFSAIENPVLWQKQVRDEWG